MADHPDLYRARAADERAKSAAATLDNVKERCDRSARAWDAMASRSERTETARVERAAASAERVAVAAAERDGDPDED